MNVWVIQCRNKDQEKADIYIFTDKDEMKCEMKGARKEYDYVSVDAFWIKRSRKTKEQV